jgi:hypothetical protein
MNINQDTRGKNIILIQTERVWERVLDWISVSQLPSSSPPYYPFFEIGKIKSKTKHKVFKFSYQSWTGFSKYTQI